MKLFYLFLIFIIPSGVFACMPPYPGEVMIGRIDSISDISSGFLDVRFSSYIFPFGEQGYKNPTSWKYYPHDDFAVRHTFPRDIHTDSLIIALSDAQDGSFPHDYSIFHITSLHCKNNNFSLGSRDGEIHGWNRKKGGCGHAANSLLDVFPDGDESIWIKKLQEKYPTCDLLEKAFPSKEDVSMGIINTPSFDNDVFVISTSFVWFDWILLKIDNFFKLF